MTLSQGARARLTSLAREAIEAQLKNRPAPRPDLRLDAELGRPSGAFVTLTRRKDGELRGCVGFIEPLYPLAETVARAAVAAATRDGRFAPVQLAELGELAIDISVLAPPSSIAPEAVEVGRHGLIVERGVYRGLLLPQVAVEQAWDARTFLEHTCLKAGLDPGAWQKPGTKLLAFEAEVFGEGEPGR